jgi:tetratricopeptide (TPR) repeat protein
VRSWRTETAHFYLGEAYLALKRHDDARRNYEISLNLDGNSKVAKLAKERLASLKEVKTVNADRDKTKDKVEEQPSVSDAHEFLNELVKRAYIGIHSTGDIRVYSGRDCISNFEYIIRSRDDDEIYAYKLQIDWSLVSTVGRRYSDIEISAGVFDIDDHGERSRRGYFNFDFVDEKQASRAAEAMFLLRQKCEKPSKF